MKYLLFENLAVLICSVIGFLFGIQYLNTRKALYAQMIVQGMICITLGRLFQCLLLITGGSLTERFQTGHLGAMGAFAFFFSSNFGQIDSLVDDGGAQFRKYRLLALPGPACAIALLVPILISPANPGFKISSGIVGFTIGAAAYFHLKHLLIPDVDYGVVRCLRGYNALALTLSALSLLELNALAWGSDVLLCISGVGLCITGLLLVKTMDRGMKKMLVRTKGKGVKK